MRERFKVWVPLEVRWNDLDALGHVNNAIYLSYFEVARLAYFQKLGYTFSFDEEGPILANAMCNYRHPVTYPAKLEVAIRVSEMGMRSFSFEYAICLADSEILVADGSTVVVWMDYKKNCSMKLSQKLRELILDLENDTISVH